MRGVVSTDIDRCINASCNYKWKQASVPKGSSEINQTNAQVCCVIEYLFQSTSFVDKLTVTGSHHRKTNKSWLGLKTVKLTSSENRLVNN